MRRRDNGSRHRQKRSDGYSGSLEKKYQSEVGVRSELKPDLQKPQFGGSTMSQMVNQADPKE
ncbi:hypothetical protein [Paenibacillus tengchongensis]|uniref:hypothetical protein n=1 Tax=Paenibacillus tengchongensis TaxID=2608684 RepID=UPI00124CF90A|nr:hypothetical protein [Paenibacillus tengchongensis]